uniref:CrtC domain-containing protein n=1 Tax=Caenorhabditis tropicalis TaxID=1561998 RepID=A0A1I7UJM2_9PELO
MEVKFNLTVTDRKFDLTNTLVFEYSMKMDETRPHRGIKTFFWKTHSVKVGGVCPQEGGALVYRPIETTVADFEEFKNHPTARTLLGFFTPLSYQFTDPEQKQIPSFWMTGLEKDRSEMYVCQDPQKEPVKYTEEQFLSWYHRFGIMWHAEKDKEEDFASISVQKIEDNKIVAIVTMKLQIGINPINMGWNFRVSGVKKYYVPDQAVFSPALDSNTVTFKTISQAERNGIETEYENEWKFDVKWDKVDQFYYVEQMKIGCHEKIVDGNYGPTARYADIDYGVP